MLKGDGPDGEAALCTRSKTYRVKYVETSNTQLLLHGTRDDVSAAHRDVEDDAMEDQAAGAYNRTTAATSTMRCGAMLNAADHVTCTCRHYSEAICHTAAGQSGWSADAGGAAHGIQSQLATHHLSLHRHIHTHFPC